MGESCRVVKQKQYFSGMLLSHMKTKPWEM